MDSDRFKCQILLVSACVSVQLLFEHHWILKSTFWYHCQRYSSDQCKFKLLTVWTSVKTFMLCRRYILIAMSTNIIVLFHLKAAATYIQLKSAGDWRARFKRYLAPNPAHCWHNLADTIWVGSANLYNDHAGIPTFARAIKVCWDGRGGGLLVGAKEGDWISKCACITFYQIANACCWAKQVCEANLERGSVLWSVSTASNFSGREWLTVRGGLNVSLIQGTCSKRAQPVKTFTNEDTWVVHLFRRWCWWWWWWEGGWLQGCRWW